MGALLKYNLGDGEICDYSGRWKRGEVKTANQ